MIYNDSSIPTPVIYRSLFVNTTVEVLEKRAEWTVASTITWLLTLGGLGLAAYVIAQNTNLLSAVTGAAGSATGGKKGGKKAGSSSGTQFDDASDPAAAAASWDVKVYKPSNAQKAFGAKKLVKPKDK